MVGGTVGAQAAGVEIWLEEQAYFHAGNIPEHPLSRSKDLPQLYPTEARGPLAGSRWQALQLAVISPCDHKPGGGRNSVLPLLLSLQPSTGSGSKQETFCPNKIQLVN